MATGRKASDGQPGAIDQLNYFLYAVFHMTLLFKRVKFNIISMECLGTLSVVCHYVMAFAY